MELLNFSEALEIAPEYTGSEKKKTMILNDKKYLVKFPDPNRSSKLEISYINNVYSEYLGTKVFEICGFETQKVVLGIYDKDGTNRYVCECEDFTNSEVKLVEFEKFENASIEPNPFKRELKIANTDRHNGNWGFLKNIKEEKLTFSPIYDCGYCLFSTYTDEDMEQCLNNSTKILDCIKNTSSAIRDNGARIKYYEFITSLENKDCNSALMRMYNKIDLNKIFDLIESIDVISKIRKEFYKKVIEEKYNKILTVAYKKLVKDKFTKV